MKWYYYLILLALILIIFIPIFVTKKNIKYLKRVGSYIISAPPRTGKSALACCLAQTHKKGRVVSPFPMKVKSDFNYLLDYNDIFNFNNYESDYAFQENDLIILDELGLKINSNDLDKSFKSQQESLGMFCKLIGHMFNGTLYLIEQHPNRIPVQAREKVEYIIQIKKLRILGFVAIFKLNLYTNIDDYNKVVFSKRKTKKLIKKGIMPPSFSGEAVTMTLFFPKSWLNRYNARALRYIHDLKELQSPKKELEQATSLDFEYDDLKNAGLNKLDNILNKDKTAK